eukprot:709576-Rhodomonas_salina.1
MSSGSRSRAQTHSATHTNPTLCPCLPAVPASAAASLPPSLSHCIPHHPVIVLARAHTLLTTTGVHGALLQRSKVNTTKTCTQILCTALSPCCAIKAQHPLDDPRWMIHQVHHLVDHPTPP